MKCINELQFVCFRIGENKFAVDIMRVREIILPLDTTPLPKSSAALDGVINLRGQIIPLLNIIKRLDLNTSVPSKSEGKFIILNYVNLAVAINVHEVLEVLTIPVNSITLPPDVDEGVSSDFLVGVFLYGDDMFMIINPDTICLPVDSYYSVCSTSNPKALGSEQQ